MSARRFFAVAGQELSYTLRRPSFWIMLGLAGLIVWGLSNGHVRVAMSSGDSSVGGKKAWLTSEFAIAQVVTITSFTLISFFVAVAAGLAVIRDLEWKTGALLHATPLRPGEYVWGKFSGVLGGFVIAQLLLVLLMILFFQLWPNAEMLETRGPFALRNYLVPTLVLGLPTLVFAAGTAFGIGTRTERPILVFVLPVILIVLCGFFLWTWAPAWLDPRIDRFLMLIDPTGYRWLNQTWLKVDRGVDFYNTRPVGWDAGFLISRLAIAGIGLASTALAGRHFRRTIRSSGRVKVGARASEPSQPAVAEEAAPTIGAIGMTASPPGFWKGFRLVAGAELKELRSSPGLYLFLPLILWQALGAALLSLGPFDTPLLLTPGTLAVGSMNTLITLLALLIVFYAVESLERERATGFAPISDALPVSSGSILAGKGAALAVVALVVLVATFVGGAIAMLVQGRVGVAVGPFVLVWGLILLPGFVLWTAFVFAVYALVKNRYTTYGITLVAFGGTVYLLFSDQINWLGNWPLWGALRWSDISRFEIDRTALILNRLFVLAVAAVLLRLAIRHFPRRATDAIGTIHGLRPIAVWRATRRTIPWLVGPIVLGAMLWHEIDRGPGGALAKKIGKDYWKKNVATWTDAPIPALSDVDLHLTLEPATRTWRVEGTYLLINKETDTLPKFPVSVGLWDGMTWKLDGKPAKPDTASHLFVFTPTRPLLPGDSVRLGFTYTGTQRGATRNGGGAGEFILPSGVVMTSFGPRWFPLVGYADDIGVDDDNRAEPRQYPDDFYRGVTPPAFGSALPMTTRITIVAPADLTVNSVGERVSEKVEGGRRTTVWKTDYPVMAFNVVAGRYTVRKGHGTALYYDARHHYNIEEMIGALDAARRYYGEWFAPFPWKELKITEFPALATYAQGFPTNISFSEEIGFLTRSEPKTNLAFLVTAHETAHQWWGNLLQPGRGPSGNILSEGMAHFSTALLIARVKGELEGMEFRKRIESRYGDSRRSDAERSLERTDGSHDGDQTVLYDKGGWAFWMLWDLMGAERNFAGLRSFIESHRGNPDHAVLHDFAVHMRGYAPDSTAYDEFAKQWFESVVVPEYKLSGARTAKVGEEWETTVRVENAGTGRMPVEVAVTTGRRVLDRAAGPAPPYRAAKTRVTLGPKESGEVTIRSPFKPERIVVDPDVRVLQLRRAAAQLDL